MQEVKEQAAAEAAQMKAEWKERMDKAERGWRNENDQLLKDKIEDRLKAEKDKLEWQEQAKAESHRLKAEWQERLSLAETRATREMQLLQQQGAALVHEQEQRRVADEQVGLPG